MRRFSATVLVAGCIAASAAGIADAVVRKHRLRRPPKPALPRVVSVDEVEYALNASRTVVTAGRVKFNVYNRGQDDHDLVIYDGSGAELGKSILLPGATDQLVVTLPAGEYRVVCSLFAGTPVSHETLGMKFVLRVESPPGFGAVTARR